MTTLGNTHARIPDWEVTAVFDPHGEGHDFAYTVVCRRVARGDLPLPA